MADYNQEIAQSFRNLGFTEKEFGLLQLFRQFIYPIATYNLAICEYSDAQSKISMIMPERLSSNKEFTPIQFFMDIKAYITVCNEQVKINPNAPIGNKIIDDFVKRLTRTDWPPTKWAEFIKGIKDGVRDLRSDPVFCYPEHIAQKDADVAMIFEEFKKIIETSLSCDLFLFKEGITFSQANYNIRPDTRISVFRDHFLAKAHYPLGFMSAISAALAEIIRILNRKGHINKMGIQTRPVVGKVSEQGLWEKMNSFFNPRPEVVPYKILQKPLAVKKAQDVLTPKTKAVEKVAEQKIKRGSDWIPDFVDEVAAIGAAPGDLKAYDIIKILPVLDKAISDRDISWPMFKYLCSVSAEEFRNFLSVINSILDYNWDLASTQDKVIFNKDVKGQDKLFALNPKEVAAKFSDHFKNSFSAFLEANLKLGIGRDIELKKKIFHGGNNNSPPAQSSDEAVDNLFK